MSRGGYEKKGSGHGSKKIGSQGERKGPAKKEGGVPNVNNPRGIEPARIGSKKSPLSPSKERSGKVGK